MPYCTVTKQYSDIIMDPTSIPGRMNAGRLYESYFGTASRNAKRIVMEDLGVSLEEASDKDINKAFNSVLEFVSILDNEQYATYKEVKSIEDKTLILEDIIENEFYIYYKISSKKKSHAIIKDMEQTRFKVPRERVMIDGKLTKHGITIGTLYVMLLNKISEGYLASASASVNHFGIPVRVNTSTKTGLPFTNNPTKIISETESRLYRSYAKSPVLAAELKDRASSISSHSTVYGNILRAKTPTNMDTAIDRTIHPYGTDNSLNLLKDIFNSTGINFKYVKGID